MIRKFLAGAALMLAAAAGHANLVTNGGFESGLTGWTCSAPDGTCGTGTQGMPAVEGVSYFFGFDNGSGGTLSQGLSTITGGVYSITFLFNTNGSVPPNALDLQVGSLSTTLPLQTATWNSFSSTFTATSALSTLDFGFLTVAGTGTVWIDGVDVELVSLPAPEPSSLALVGLALLVLGRSLRARD